MTAMDTLLVSTSFADATVNYEGFVYADEFSFMPVQNGFAIAGTFPPGFDPYSYHCVYGDTSCNLNAGHYSAAVGDGNFVPIGAGDLTDASGFFSGSGTTSAAAGTPVYLFVFATPDPDTSFYWGLATSTHPSFLVPAANGDTTLNAGLADTFIHGADAPGGIALRVVPFPEPSAFVFTLTAFSFVGCGRKRRWCKSAH
jgi:hypothetical protein